MIPFFHFFAPFSRNFIGFRFIHRFDSWILMGDFFCFGNSVRGGRDAINRVSTYARIKPPQSIKSIGDRWLMINIHVYDLASQQNFPIRRRGIVWGFLSNIFRPINRFHSGFLKGEFWFRKLLMMKRLVCFFKLLRNVFFKIVGLRFF